MLVLREPGLYCPLGDFYIDPETPVPRAVLTHGHSDHAVMGSAETIATAATHAILNLRHGESSSRRSLAYGETLTLGAVSLSLHSAGHILGSAQVRVQGPEEVWVVSGDYKRTPDPTVEPFEVVPCDRFITESTFALPLYSWPDTAQVAREVYDWAMQCAAEKKFAVIYAYALGKAQRLLAHLAACPPLTIYAHGSMIPMLDLYRSLGIPMPHVESIPALGRKNLPPSLVIAPPGAHESKWLKSFGDYETGFASGWMLTRGKKRHGNYDRGFVISDHASWSEIMQTVEQVNPKHVYATHGFRGPLVRYLRETGRSADDLDVLKEVAP